VDVISGLLLHPLESTYYANVERMQLAVSKGQSSHTPGWLSACAGKKLA
jgi:hypothetical protein